jgi:integrase
MGWAEFREYHEEHCLRALADRTFDAYVCALNVYERFHKPDRLSDITAARVTAWQTELRKEGKSEASIASYTRHLKATLRWAHEQRLLSTLPKLAMPKRAKSAKVMKGRPITTEEFERMLAAVPKVVMPKPKKETNGEVDPEQAREQERHALAVVESWKHFLRGLWWSGLRLGESLVLRWDAEPGAIVVDFTGRRPMLRIPGEAEKGGKDRLLPMAPEFAGFLAAIPEAERHGRVFKLIGKHLAEARMQTDWVSRTVSEIGRKAGVVVDRRERRLVVDARRKKAMAKPETSKGRKAKGEAGPDDGVKCKYASAHDLRRAFGLRWSSRVMPAVLQQLMRHESIETTMRYYVGRDADAVADTLWEAVEAANGRPAGNKTGNKRPNADSDGAKEKSQSQDG